MVMFDYFRELPSRIKTSSRLRFNYIMSKIENLETGDTVVYDDSEIKESLKDKVDITDIFKDGVFWTENTKNNGTYAKIWNEADGGGSQLIDGTTNIKSYVGVHEGGDGTGIYVQIYAVNNSNNIGTRINITDEGAFLTKNKKTYTWEDDDEIATIGKVKELIKNLNE